MCKHFHLRVVLVYLIFLKNNSKIESELLKGRKVYNVVNCIFYDVKHACWKRSLLIIKNYDLRIKNELFIFNHYYSFVFRIILWLFGPLFSNTIRLKKGQIRRSGQGVFTVLKLLFVYSIPYYCMRGVGCSSLLNFT